MQTFSHSQVALWNKCRYAWFLRYINKVVPRYDRPSLSIGSAIHVGVAAGLKFESIEGAINQWRDKKLALELNEEEQTELTNICGQAELISRRTIKNLDIGHKWETVKLQDQPLIEYKFEIGAVSGTPWVGYVDWIARECDTGAVWLVDHKCYSQFQPETSEEVNVQMAVYQYLLAMHGISAVGSICHQIRPTLPSQPKVNQNGTISRAACTTDWETYCDAIRAVGGDPNDYIDMKEKLEKVEFWRMTRAYRSEREIAATWDNMVATTNVMSQRPLLIYRSMGVMNCNGCHVRELCLEELRGSDTDYLLKTKYRRTDEPNEFSVEMLEE